MLHPTAADKLWRARTMSGLVFTPSPGSLNGSEFLNVFGGVYEHSAWIAKQAWAQDLDGSYNTPERLAEILSNIVDTATTQQQMDLILAHPDLAGKAAKAGEMTPESSDEQSGAGINLCSAKEFAQFQKFNQAYRAKFKHKAGSFAVRANRYQILKAFEQRLPNPYRVEFEQALLQIHKIARFRLNDIAQKPED